MSLTPDRFENIIDIVVRVSHKRELADSMRCKRIGNVWLEEYVGVGSISAG